MMKNKNSIYEDSHSRSREDERMRTNAEYRHLESSIKSKKQKHLEKSRINN